jgi:hypothetical protein
MDASWYKEFCKYGSFETYEFLDGDALHRNDQRTKFLNGHIEFPSLDYPFIVEDDFKRRIEGLLQLKTNILSQEEIPAIRSIYQEKINEKIADCRMLLASKNNDYNAFEKYNLYVYDKVDEDIAYKNLVLYLSEIKDIKSHAAAIQQALVEELINKCNLAHQTVILPDHWLAYKQDYIGQLVHDFEINCTDIIDSAQLLQMFNKGLQFFNIEGWTLEHPESSKSSISVNQSKKLISVPNNKKYSKARAIELILHEIGAHVKRRENGKYSKLKLSQIGLARYEAFEEGMAKIMEHGKHSGTPIIMANLKHLAIAMANGTYGINFSFRAVFDFIKRHYKIDQSNKVIGDASLLAYVTTIRTFRGTDCNTPGNCYLKDKVYYEGLIKAIDHMHDVKDFDQLFAGKYDFTNLQQLKWLKELGVIN